MSLNIWTLVCLSKTEAQTQHVFSDRVQITFRLVVETQAKSQAILFGQIPERLASPLLLSREARNYAGTF